VKLVHLVGFITKKFVTMHGHMNVKLIFPTYICHFLVTIFTHNLGTTTGQDIANSSILYSFI